MNRSPVPAPEPAPYVTDLVPYQPGKPIAEVRRELGLSEVVKLASNENALGPSPMALDAIVAAARDVHLYPEGACPDLRHALARSLGIQEGELVFGNGSDELIHLLGLAYLEPGDEVLQAVPTFVRYEAAAILNQARCVSVPLCEWAYDVDVLLAAVTHKTRIVFIANPNNPTGSYLTGKDTERLLDNVGERCIVCFDEAYYEYVHARDYPDTLEYVRSRQNVVVLRTFSKIYGLAGLRIGYGIARPEIVAALERVREPFNVNSLAQVAARAALDDADHVQRSREMTVVGRAFLTERLAGLGLRVYPSQGNFLWVDAGRDCRALFQALLRLGVIVRTGDIFGAPTFLRITVGQPRENERLVHALKEVLQA